MAVLERPRRGGLDAGGRGAPRSWCSTTTSSRRTPSAWSRGSAARAGAGRVALREEPARAADEGGAGARRGSCPTDALRLALTGTPILNRPEELVAQLRVLGRLREFGSGARLARRFRNAGSDDRLHWNLRAHCYVRRTKKQVLPQLPAKRQDTVPVLLSNEHEYRLAEKDVIAWLQTLPLDLRTIDAKVAAALRAEQLVRLNNLRQLAAARQAAHRARLDRRLPRVGRAARGVRRAHRDPEGACSSASPTPCTSSARTPTPSRQRRRRRLPERGRAAADRLLDAAPPRRASRSRAPRTSRSSSSTGRPPATTRRRTACTGSARTAP